ncbi:MAG: methyltransferase domain-containing protein, partial [Pseudomonadota bacterium]
WPSVKGLTLAGFGFAAPVLPPLRLEAQRALALMPAQQGAIPWPRDGGNLVALVDPYRWPVHAAFLDRLILTHALENVDRPDRLLEECWRALAPEGRLLVMAPNRSGLWARRDGTPFGAGRPYSFGQLDTLLRNHGFMVSAHEGALYFPPSQRRTLLRAGNLIERAGRRLDWSRLAGVLFVEAVKRVSAPRSGLKIRAARPVGALQGVGVPTRPAPVGLFDGPRPGRRRQASTGKTTDRRASTDPSRRT